MPQMKPMSWLMIFSMLMIFLLLMFNSFKPILLSKTNQLKITTKKKNMKW